MEISLSTIDTWAAKTRHWNPIVRWRARRTVFYAAWGLRRESDPKHLELFVALLSFPDSGVVTQGARALSRIGGEKAIQALIHSLENPQALNPEKLAWALGRLRSVEGVPVLCEWARRGLPEAVHALGLIGDKQAGVTLTALLTALVDENYSVAQQEALLNALFGALGRLGATPALPILERFWEQNLSRDLPESFFFALGELGHEQTLERLESHACAGAAVRRLRSRRNRARYEEGMRRKQSEW